MPNPESKHIPPWAERQRAGDLRWISENIDVFWTAARAGFEELGRGAIVVDTTVLPPGASGHPFGFMPQEMVELVGDEDAIRMVAEYEPVTEIVTVLLKSEERVSTYRVQVLGQAKGRR